IDVKGADAPDAQLNAAPRANVRNTSAPNNDIIQQTRWENQVDKFVAALGDAYAKGESAVLGKLTGGRIKNALSVKRAAKDIYEITNDFKIAQEQMNAQAKEVMDFINKSIGEEDRLALFRTLNGDAAPDELPAHMIPTYEKFRKLIDTNAQALVDAGVLKEKYKIDDYLKRYYKDYIEQRDGFTKKYFDNFKARKNLTEDERIALGMVQDAGFAIANTLKEQRVQLIKAKKSLWS
ncbi:MAG: hypothetical protein LBB59_02445, partial [Campylobacteraceae bacterium]|nr:hypothetical protein [Campylobacteraceae bacterium]